MQQRARHSLAGSYSLFANSTGNNNTAVGVATLAEEVEKVDANLVYRNNKGQVESVCYEMVNAMLLNEFLKEHRKVAQKVSAQLELNRPHRQPLLIIPKAVNQPKQ